MPAVARSGRARISLRNPQAMGECDRCGLWVSYKALSRQFQWAGNSLRDTGYLVCSDTCLDVPQDQYRSPILPADPYPIINPRPSANVTPYPIIGQPLPTSPTNAGFTVYNIGAQGIPGQWPSSVSSSQAAVLAQVEALSGVTAPASVTASSTAMARNTSMLLLAPPGTTRSFLLIYNPTTIPVQFSLAYGTISGAIGNLMIGPGQAFLWATSQGLQTCTQLPVSAISQYGGGLPLWCWADATALSFILGQTGRDVLGVNILGYPSTGLVNNGGILVFSDPTAYAGWPTSPIGLPNGALWNNGNFLVGVAGVTSPSAAAAPLYFGLVTSAELLATGGANLPTTEPAIGSLQLWNNAGNGGFVCVA